MKKIIFFTFLVLILNAYSVYANTDAKQTKELYKDASSEFVSFPKESQSLVKEVLKGEWIADPILEEIIKSNTQALALFKKASMGESDGWLFTDKVEEINFLTDIPDFQNEIKLLKVLIIETNQLKASGNHAAAKENLIAASSFLAHIALEELDTVIKTLIEAKAFEICIVSFVDSLEYDDYYKRNLKQNLNIIYNNQDFFEQSVRNDFKAQRNTIDVLEAKFYKEKNFEQAFYNLFTTSDTCDIKNPIMGLTYHFNARHTKEFFAELRRLIGDELNTQENLLVAAFKNDDFVEYRNYYRKLEQSYESILDNTFLYMIKKLWLYKGRLHLCLAQYAADIWLSAGTPQYKKASSKYRSYYKSLEGLREQMRENE